MCPEGGVLSAYLDGELEAPWKASVEAHVAGCPACAVALERLRSVRERLKGDEEPELVETMARVRNALAARIATPSHRWRSITVPLPLAAIAACLVLLLGGGLVLSAFRRPDTSPVRLTLSPTGFVQLETEVPAEDVRKLLDALNGGGADRTVVLSPEIPEGYRLIPLGEPELLPAVQRSSP